MELYFVAIMAGITFLVFVFIYVITTHSHRKCKNCYFFRRNPRSKYSGSCHGYGEHHFCWEPGCGHWKRKPIKALEDW